MFNFHSKKTRKIFSTVLIIILVVSMVLPLILSAIV